MTGGTKKGVPMVTPFTVANHSNSHNKRENSNHSLLTAQGPARSLSGDRLFTTIPVTSD